MIGSDYSIDLTCQERELTIWRVDYNVFSQHGKGDLSIAGTYQQIWIIKKGDWLLGDLTCQYRRLLLIICSY